MKRKPTRNPCKVIEFAREILKLSRLNCAEVHPIHLDLCALVREVVQDATRRNADRRINWQIERFPPVEADPELMRIALANLVANAAKFTRSRDVAQIRIGSSRDVGETIVFVRDNGVGFDPKDKERLFRLFQRLHAAASYEGGGFGLVQVRHIVARHGGRTWAEPNPQGGATFYFSIPDSPVCFQPQHDPLLPLSQSPIAA